MMRRDITEHLIGCVRRCPSLWDVMDPEYTTWSLNASKWERIYLSLITKFGSELLAEERILNMKDVRKKWHTLRDSFRKYYKKQLRGERVGKWVWMNHLAFLAKNMPQKKKNPKEENPSDLFDVDDFNNVNAEVSFVDPQMMFEETGESTAATTTTPKMECDDFEYVCKSILKDGVKAFGSNMSEEDHMGKVLASRLSRLQEPKKTKAFCHLLTELTKFEDNFD